jgi:hypothetical protein
MKPGHVKNAPVAAVAEVAAAVVDTAAGVAAAAVADTAAAVAAAGAVASAAADAAAETAADAIASDLNPQISKSKKTHGHSSVGFYWGFFLPYFANFPPSAFTISTVARLLFSV